MVKFAVDHDSGEIAEHPSDHECSCENRNPDDHVLTITEGTPAVTHIVCGKQIDDQGYIEDWNTSEPIPVRVEFVDEGMDYWTGEHNGFWWELSPRPVEEWSCCSDCGLRLLLPPPMSTGSCPSCDNFRGIMVPET